MKVKLVLQFAPSWWFHNYGFRFDESYYYDPVSRLRTTTGMRERFCIEFPSIPPDCLRLEVGRNLGFVPLLIFLGACGSEIRCSEDQDPWAVTPTLLSDEDVEAFRPPDLARSPFVMQQLDQVEYLARHYDRREIAALGKGETAAIHSSLTCAFKLVGERLFTLLYDRPDLAHHLLDTTTRVNSMLIDLFTARRGVEARDIDISDCVAALLPPHLYGQFGLRCNVDIVNAYGATCGVHSCGVSTHLLREFVKVPRITWCEVGWGTDLQEARDVCAAAGCQLRVLMNPALLIQWDKEQVRANVAEVIRAAYPHDLVLRTGAMEYGTPRDNVCTLYAAVEELCTSGDVRQA